MAGTGTGTALITGANRGIGQQVAKDLARAGWNVLVGTRDLAKGEAAVSRVKKERANGNVKVRAELVDVGDERSIAALADRLAKAKITLGCLVNNAGIYGEAKDPTRYGKVVRVNFFGALRVTDALTPLLEKTANVVMVTSGLGDLAHLAETLAIRARFSAPDLDRAALLALVDEVVANAQNRSGEYVRDSYSLSKAALNALVRVLAKEQPGWRVNATCPGWVRTDMGGKNAPRTVEEGAASVTWGATLGPDGPTGGVFRDGKKIPF